MNSSDMSTRSAGNHLVSPLRYRSQHLAGNPPRVSRASATSRRPSPFRRRVRPGSPPFTSGMARSVPGSYDRKLSGRTPPHTAAASLPCPQAVPASRTLVMSDPYGWQHLRLMQQETDRFFRELHRDQGDIARFPLGSQTCWSFAHPEAVHQILATHWRQFQKTKIGRAHV